METILPLLTALVVLGIGLVYGYFAVRLTYEQIQVWRLSRLSRNWPGTEAVIETSEIIDEGVRRFREQPRVTYTYHVAGTQYQGERINFSFADIYDKKEAEAALAPYPLHARVPVYYDPANPSQSSLELRHTGLASGLVVGLIVFLPTCLCLAVGLHGMFDALGK
jgi:hypothetical protein